MHSFFWHIRSGRVLALAICLVICGTSAVTQAAMPSVEPLGAASVAIRDTADATDPTAGSIPPQIPTSAFAGRTPYANARLSPDGLHIALSMIADKQASIVIYDIETETFARRLRLGAEQDVEWLRWAGKNRVLIGLSGADEVYGVVVRYTRTFVLDLPTNSLAYVGNKSMGIIGDDVLYVDPDGEWILLAMQRSLFDEPEVWRMSLDRRNADADERIQKRKTDVWDWYADDEGVVRLGLGYARRRLKVWYRGSAEEKFKVIAKLKQDAEDEEYWEALRIVEGSDEGYLLREDEDGRVVLRRFNYATRQDGEVIFRNDNWDLTGYDLDEEGNPSAVYFTDDLDRIVWLDEEMAKTQRVLEKTLSGHSVWITGRARDESRMLIWAGGPTEPGIWYIYTPARREMKSFIALRPEIDSMQLAPVEPVSFAARDGTPIHSYLTLPPGREARNLPLVVIPHGGPYGVRDKLTYSDEVQLLANRGYAVLQPNYRGSGGYGEAFATLGAGEIGRRMQDDLDDAVAWIVEQGIVDNDRVCMVGSSYGGYAAMWAAIRNPGIYRCAVSFAGVSDLKEQLEYDEDFLTRAARRSWKAQILGADEKFDLDTISPATQAARIGSPLLLVHGEKDRRVPFKQFKYMRDALKDVPGAQVEFLTFADSGHGFYSTEDEQSYYDHLLAFLAKHNPPDALQVVVSGD